MTTKNKTIEPLEGIKLLEGEQTVTGQILVRLKTIKSCFKAIKDKSIDIHPNILRSFVKSHRETLRELYFRKLVTANNK